MKSSRAFTLLELLIVLLIIGILIAIGLYRYQSVVEASQDKTAQADVRAVFINANAYKSQNPSAFPLDLAGELDNPDGVETNNFTPGDQAPVNAVGVEGVGDDLLVVKQAPSEKAYCLAITGDEIISGVYDPDEAGNGSMGCVANGTTIAPDPDPEPVVGGVNLIGHGQSNGIYAFDSTAIPNTTEIVQGGLSLPKYSPDGLNIIYRQVDFGGDGFDSLYAVNSTGSEAPVYLGGVNGPSPYAWLDNNTVLVIDNNDIYSVARTGGARTNLTNTPSLSETAMSVSPNSQTIAFVRGGNIYTIPAAGGTSTLLFDAHPSYNLAWMTNDNLVARRNSGAINVSSLLYRIPLANPNTPVQLSTEGTIWNNYAVSSNGTTIVATKPDNSGIIIIKDALTTPVTSEVTTTVENYSGPAAFNTTGDRAYIPAPGNGIREINTTNSTLASTLNPDVDLSGLNWSGRQPTGQ